MNYTFEGTAKLRSSIKDFVGEEKTDLRIRFIIDLQDDGGCTVAVGDFRLDPISVKGPLGIPFNLEVTLIEPASGEWSFAEGTLRLTTPLEFSIPGPDAELELDFGTATQATLPGTDFTYAGRAADKASGQLALAALGTFSSGLIDGEDCMALLAGSLTPNPWAEAA